MSHATHPHPPSETTGSRWTDAQRGLSAQSFFSTRRSGVAPPRLGTRQDHAAGVEEEARSTRRSAVTPTPTATRQGGHTSGHDVDAAEKDGPSHPEEEQEEEEETHPTPIKDAQTTPVGIADPPPGP